MILRKGGKTIELKSEAQIAAYLNAGYAEVKAPPEKSPAGTGKELKDLNLDELAAYAQEKGIDIGQATTPAGIFKKIQEAEQAAGAEGK